MLGILHTVDSLTFAAGNTSVAVGALCLVLPLVTGYKDSFFFLQVLKSYMKLMTWLMNARPDLNVTKAWAAAVCQHAMRCCKVSSRL